MNGCSRWKDDETDGWNDSQRGRGQAALADGLMAGWKVGWPDEWTTVWLGRRVGVWEVGRLDAVWMVADWTAGEMMMDGWMKGQPK